MTSGTDITRNLEFIEKTINSLREKQIDLFLLPEMFAQFGASDQFELGVQETSFKGEVGACIRRLAKTFGIWIVAGTVPSKIETDDRPRARCHVVNAKGELETYYDKIHLFDAHVGDKQGSYRESDSYSPGSNIVVFDSPWGKMGLSVCYDLRFPELYRQLNDQGAKLIFAPSAFTYNTGRAHWDVLIRSRAIENGLFIVASNQTGQHDAKRQTWGHSMMANPWGDVDVINPEENTLILDVDLTKVDEVRKKLPVNNHRRLN